MAIVRAAGSDRGPVYDSRNYATLSALFTAAAAAGDRVNIFIAPGTYTTAPLRVDASDVTIEGYGASITLANGSNDNLLTIGPNALNFNMFGVTLNGNSANQSVTVGPTVACDGVFFEEYTGVFRVADRSNLTECAILDMKRDGIHIAPKRIEIQMRHCAVRTFGRYGVYMDSTDCAFDHGAIGIGQVCCYMTGQANWLRNSGLYSATDYAVRVEGSAAYCYIVDNTIDNNFGGGLAMVGTSGNTMGFVVSGNNFHGNSRTGAGSYPDIYLEQVREITLTGNVTSLQGGSNQTSYAVQFGTNVGRVYGSGNGFDPNAHASGIYSTTGIITNISAPTAYTLPATTDFVTTTRVGADTGNRFGLRADGVMVWGAGAGATDTNLYRTAVGTLRTDSLFQIPRLNLVGTAGNGNIYFESNQSGPPPAPGAGAAYMFTRDNGSGKGQLCVRFPTGAIQVVATEP